jgi:hypothetical protein
METIVELSLNLKLAQIEESIFWSPESVLNFNLSQFTDSNNPGERNRAWTDIEAWS